jgi:hypothetical protein
VPGREKGVELYCYICLWRSGFLGKLVGAAVYIHAWPDAPGNKMQLSHPRSLFAFEAFLGQQQRTAILLRTYRIYPSIYILFQDFLKNNPEFMMPFKNEDAGRWGFFFFKKSWETLSSSKVLCSAVCFCHVFSFLCLITARGIRHKMGTRVRTSRAVVKSLLTCQLYYFFFFLDVFQIMMK